MIQITIPALCIIFQHKWTGGWRKKMKCINRISTLHPFTEQEEENAFMQKHTIAKSTFHLWQSFLLGHFLWTLLRTLTRPTVWVVVNKTSHFSPFLLCLKKTWFNHFSIIVDYKEKLKRKSSAFTTEGCNRGFIMGACKWFQNNDVTGERVQHIKQVDS